MASLASLQAAAVTLRIKIVPAEARTAQKIEAAFAAIQRDKSEAVIVIPDTLLNSHARQVAALAAKFRLPSMTSASVYPEAGCLMSYGTNLYEHLRRTAYFVDRIFKGAKPADLPIEQPTRFELFINGKTAQALGLKIPQSLSITAEKVIE